jgi:hypothetical protein
MARLIVRLERAKDGDSGIVEVVYLFNGHGSVVAVWNINL